MLRSISKVAAEKASASSSRITAASRHITSASTGQTRRRIRRYTGCCCQHDDLLHPRVHNRFAISLSRRRFKSTAAAAALDYDAAPEDSEHFAAASVEVHRLSHLRNVGVLAHVDAGKTTVTERMLALAGVVRRAGSVDSGNTVTDYLPAERERGITIQSAAISFDWGWHNNRTGDDYDQSDNVTIHLIDTPGHVDFSVEVNRSVAVLDGAVLVVDAVAGVQAQTETVWRAITRPSMNNHGTSSSSSSSSVNGSSRADDHGHEPLPCLAIVNKMDKEGCNFGLAVRSLRFKLPGANPIAIQIPLFRVGKENHSGDNGLTLLPPNLFAVDVEDLTSPLAQNGEFVGVIDLVHMRAVVWPEMNTASAASNVEECIPTVINLIDDETHALIDPDCQVTQVALASRADLVGHLADVDEAMEEYYLDEEDPSNAALRAALRRVTLSRKALPVMAGAALRGKGVEPLLDCIADLLPSPLDRVPPALNHLEDSASPWSRKKKDSKGKASSCSNDDSMPQRKINLGHPLHSKTLALAFKVLHMKGRGGSGDGRVVFARVYSGKIRARDTLKIITPPLPGAKPEPPRTERVGSLLELAGGRFDNLENGSCSSGDVCALVGLKSVATGDTILLASDDTGSKKSRGKKRSSASDEDIGNVCLAGVASPKPVLTVRVEAESAEQQAKLSNALALLSVEDPSLFVEETDSATLLSGLGELHIEIVLDRLRREFGLQVTTGSPAVAYRETVTNKIETNGLVEYDRTIGDTRLQAAVQLMIEPVACPDAALSENSSCMLLSDPIVTIGPRAREYLGVGEELSEEELIYRSEVVKSLVSGCLGSLKRGQIGPHSLANVRCHVLNIDAEGGMPSLTAMPGSLRAAAANAVATLLIDEPSSCTVLEPTMSVEITLPSEMVGTVLSDLTGRRGTVGDVIMGEDENDTSNQAPGHAKALVRGEVPLIEILGYANSLRSLTGGEAAFTAEYKGHSPCD
mmetsp:Transcript_13052/g.28289  ORF Transcript_13052/g.28289 Transcript_13052/m.28289 type:complete len:977 (-) Transcript_13052:55-2985(-)